MSRPNRVGPDGEFAERPARGELMGNRGILHDEHGNWTGRKWAHRSWVSCALSYKDRKRKINAPGRYTELFFLDEAVSLTAGHRPCHTCRRGRFAEVMALYHRLHDTSSPAEVDAHLNNARCVRGGQQLRFKAEVADLPDGCFVLADDTPLLLLGDHVLPYRGAGYGAPRPRPEHIVTVLTPRPFVDLYAAGLRPELHDSARG